MENTDEQCYRKNDDYMKIVKSRGKGTITEMKNKGEDKWSYSHFIHIIWLEDAQELRLHNFNSYLKSCLLAS